MRIRFDVAAVDLAMARAYSYKYYLDGDTAGVSLVGVTVSENSDGSFSFVAPLPSSILKPTTTVNGVVTPVKSHTIQVSVSNNIGESAKSATITVNTDSPLPAPVNLKLEDTLKVPTVVGTNTAQSVISPVPDHQVQSVISPQLDSNQTPVGSDQKPNPYPVRVPNQVPNQPSPIPSSYPNPNPI